MHCFIVAALGFIYDTLKLQDSNFEIHSKGTDMHNVEQNATKDDEVYNFCTLYRLFVTCFELLCLLLSFCDSVIVAVENFIVRHCLMVAGKCLR